MGQSRQHRYNDASVEGIPSDGINRSQINDGVAEAGGNQGTQSTLQSALQSASGSLNHFLDQFAQIAELLSTDTANSHPAADQPAAGLPLNDLRQQVVNLEQQLAEARADNEELSARLDEQHEHGEPTRSSMPSWEDRRELLMSQMEDDSFDAEAFIATLQPVTEIDTDTPADHLQQLCEQLRQQEEEIKRLTQLVDAANLTTGNHTPTAATAELFDGDQLVREERERLRQLREQWETKFREGEIAASLERARLSRERRQLAQQNQQLEEQLAHLRRQVDADRKAGVPGARRWLAKLGLDDKRS